MALATQGLTLRVCPLTEYICPLTDYICLLTEYKATEGQTRRVSPLIAPGQQSRLVYFQYDLTTGAPGLTLFMGLRRALQGKPV